MSPYQQLKIILVRNLHISRDAFHILLGFFVFLAAAHIANRKLSDPRSLIAPTLFLIILELKDAYDGWAYRVFYDPIDSMKDMTIGLLLPVLTVFYLGRFKRDR